MSIRRTGFGRALRRAGRRSLAGRGRSPNTSVQAIRSCRIGRWTTGTILAGCDQGAMTLPGVELELRSTRGQTRRTEAHRASVLHLGSGARIRPSCCPGQGTSDPQVPKKTVLSRLPKMEAAVVHAGWSRAGLLSVLMRGGNALRHGAVSLAGGGARMGQSGCFDPPKQVFTFDVGLLVGGRVVLFLAVVNSGPKPGQNQRLKSRPLCT